MPCLLLATLLLTAAPAMAGELLAHRASYLLSMGHSQSGSDVVDVQGVMVYEFTDACDGWTTTQKARIQFYYDDGRRSEVGLYDYDLATYEAGDRFQHQHAEGFVRLWGLGVETWAARQARRLGGGG